MKHDKNTRTQITYQFFTFQNKKKKFSTQIKRQVKMTQNSTEPNINNEK